MSPIITALIVISGFTITIVSTIVLFRTTYIKDSDKLTKNYKKSYSNYENKKGEK